MEGTMKIGAGDRTSYISKIMYVQIVEGNKAVVLT